MHARLQCSARKSRSQGPLARCTLEGEKDQVLRRWWPGGEMLRALVPFTPNADSVRLKVDVALAGERGHVHPVRSMV